MPADPELRSDPCPANATTRPARCPQPPTHFRACDKRCRTSGGEHSQILRVHRPELGIALHDLTNNLRVGKVNPEANGEVLRQTRRLRRSPTRVVLTDFEVGLQKNPAWTFEYLHVL